LAPRLVWTGAENLIPTEIRSPDRLARSESLYGKVVALVAQDANRMRRLIGPYVACLAPRHFSTLSNKRHDFWKKEKEKLLKKNVCFDFL